MLNISKQIYAGIDTTKSNTGKLHIAEIIPAGNSPAELRRLAAISKSKTFVKEFDNKPLPGFTLYSPPPGTYFLDRYWIVIDPRGFLVKISSDNLEKILKITGITEGLIQQKCVWVREDSGTKMSLLPISSSDYKKAIANTELLENKVSIADVNIGDTVLLQNGMSGRYMGVLSLYGTLNDYYNKSELRLQIMQKRQIVELQPGKFFHLSDIRILKIISRGDVITQEESAEYINKSIGNGAIFSNSEYFPTLRFISLGEVRLAQAKNTKAVKIGLEEITRSEADALFIQCDSLMDLGVLVVEDEKGDRHIINFRYNYSSVKNSNLDNCDLCKISEILPDRIVLTEARGFRGSRNVDKLVKFYKIVKHVKHNVYV